MTKFSWTNDFKKFQNTAIAVIAAISLSACAMSAPPPTSQLQAAESAIAEAEQARVVDFAAAELRAAREKLTAARQAVQRDEMLLATYLAEESAADANLAVAITSMNKNKAINDEMQNNIDILKQELERTSGAR